MHHRRAANFRLWLIATILLGVPASSVAMVISARAYERHYFTEPGAHEAIQTSGELSGGQRGTAGWVEYPMHVAQTGWYRLSTRGDPPAGVEFTVDADETGMAPPERYFYQREFRGGTVAPVGNVWLPAGKHRVRLTRYFWTGFPRISAIELHPSNGDLSTAMHAYFRDDRRVFRKGECPALEIYGGGPAAGELEIIQTSADGKHSFGSHTISFSQSGAPARQGISLACTQAGFHRLTWRINGKASPPNAQLPVAFQIIDTSTAAAELKGSGDAPLISIDCATRAPDYASGATRIGSIAGVTYRESGDSGWIPFQRRTVARQQRQTPSWFAYALPDVTPQQRLRVEVQYPDDVPRTFAVAWRDAAPLQYVPAMAVETGREYRISGAIQTLMLRVWPRAARPRLLFLPAHDGDRAACTSIRVFADQYSSVHSPSTPSRQFLSWYEEGEHFASLYGSSPEDSEGFNTAVERWFTQAGAAGVNGIMPSVAVYNFGMYPSRFNRSFSEPERDTLRVLMLQAERYGLRVIPELHPRSDELAYAQEGKREFANLAISKDGRDNFAGPDGRNVPPYFNALNAKNQQWYIGMVHELAARYRDSPAFEGVSLRYMTWANPALNNLVDLDWGYDDASLAQYRRDTGSRIPSFDTHDAKRFTRRHQWLMANEQSAWISWRCAQVTRLFVQIRNTLREVRPDLRLYLHLFGPQVDAAATFHARLREAGLDLKALSTVDGLVIVNSSFTYGRLEQDGLFFNSDRDPLLASAIMGATADAGSRSWILPTSRYLEAIGDIVVPPRELGLPESTPTAWMSAASNPPGVRAMERFAVLLAQTDALALGDGGNNATLMSEDLTRFALEYRKLPPIPFEQVPGATDPVTVRSYTSSSRLQFYAVNREDYPIEVSILLSDGEARAVKLDAYELKVMEGPRGTSITAIQTAAPGPERERIANRVSWVQDWVTGKAGKPPSGADAELIGQALARARRALAAGHLWEAHTAFEGSAALRAFRSAGCFPPDLRKQFPEESRCQEAR